MYEEHRKLSDIYDLIASKKHPIKKIKSAYNETLKFQSLKKDVIHDYANLLDIALSDLELYSDQKGTGIKVYTPNQLITRLPILIAQLNVGNNFIDLINEIRQTLYVLYRNNVITKHVYNRLIEYCTSLIKDTTLCVIYANPFNLA